MIKNKILRAYKNFKDNENFYFNVIIPLKLNNFHLESHRKNVEHFFNLFKDTCKENSVSWQEFYLKQEGLK